MEGKTQRFVNISKLEQFVFDLVEAKRFHDYLHPLEQRTTY
jgi:hypothetical protein